MQTGRIVPMALLLSLPIGACNSPSSDEANAPEQPVFAAADERAAALAEQLSYQHLYEKEPALIDGAEELWTRRVRVDDRGAAHTRVLQTHQNIPVFGGEAIVHLDKHGKFESMTDSLVRDIQVDTKPRFTDEEAIDFAVGAKGGWNKLAATPAAELMILRHQGTDHLVYRVELGFIDDANGPSMPIMFVSAHTGETVWQYDNLQTARNRRTHTANNGTSLPGSLVLSETSGTTNDAVLQQAHDNAGITYNYYFNIFGRDSYSGTGSTINSTVHYSRNYVNAFWNGSQMVYGDGDGSQSGPLTVFDVVAHELSHAVTSYEANLTYSNESGALNEATSDIMAAAAEAYRDGTFSSGTPADTVWLVGEECWTPATSGDALRYMCNPTQDNTSRDHYSTRYIGSSDNGGVHWNSGIGNLFFCLAVKGGTHPNSSKSLGPVVGIGMEKAARIWYKALADYMTSSTNFAGARTATLNACTALGYATTVCDEIKNAWAEVGVGARADGGGTTPPPSGGTLQKDVPVSNLSASTGNWVYFTMEVPAGASNLKFTTTGGTGDMDLYVRFGSQPTTATFDCRSWNSNSAESCTIAAPQAGTYHVGLYAYAAFSGVTLTGTYTGGGSTPGYPGNELDESNLGATSGNWVRRTITVPANATKLTVTISGGTGDADLYVRFGSEPSTTTYDCRPYKSGNSESCTFTLTSSPVLQSGTYHIGVRAYSTFSGLSLVGNYE